MFEPGLTGLRIPQCASFFMEFVEINPLQAVYFLILCSGNVRSVSERFPPNSPSSINCHAERRRSTTNSTNSTNSTNIIVP